MKVNLSHKGFQVLALFMNDPKTRLSGSDIVKKLLVGSGTLYPMLQRFEGEGLLDSEWEELDPREAKRPRRKFYRITPHGQNVAQEAAAGVHQVGGLAWAR